MGTILRVEINHRDESVGVRMDILISDDIAASLHVGTVVDLGYPNFPVSEVTFRKARVFRDEVAGLLFETVVWVRTPAAMLTSERDSWIDHLTGLGFFKSIE